MIKKDLNDEMIWCGRLDMMILTEWILPVFQYTTPGRTNPLEADLSIWLVLVSTSGELLDNLPHGCDRQVQLSTWRGISRHIPEEATWRQWKPNTSSSSPSPRAVPFFLAGRGSGNFRTTLNWFIWESTRGGRDGEILCKVGQDFRLLLSN